ncbi:MAG: HD domain-containing protein [Erysipelotrichaceae bacterium]|nr:HD domain-containing protein [Erysipelotrichaceae bacterium]
MIDYDQLLMLDKPSIAFKQLHDCHSLPDYLEILSQTKQRRDYHPEGDVLTHTLMVLDEGAKCKYESEHPLWFMWSCLLHDIGKPIVTTSAGRAPYHNEAGVEIFKNITIISDAKERTYIEAMIMYHMHLMNMARNDAPDWRYLRLLKLIENKVSLNDLILISVCDKLGRGYVDYDQLSHFYDYIADKQKRLGVNAVPALLTDADLGCFGKDVFMEAYELQLQGMNKEEILRSLQKKYVKG